MKKTILFYSALVYSLLLGAQNNEIIRNNETANKHWISFDVGVHYRHIPVDNRYVPRSKGGMTSTNPIFVGYTRNTFVGPFISFNYEILHKNRFLFNSGLLFFYEKWNFNSDYDSVSIYKPFPDVPYPVRSLSHNKSLFIQYNVSYKFNRFLFSLGSSWKMLEFEKSKSKMDDGTSKTVNFFRSNGDPFYFLFVPFNISLHYQISDKNNPISLYIKYNNWIDERLWNKCSEKQFMIGLNIKFKKI